MSNLSDIENVKKILSRHGFTFSKAMGQNFLIDPDVCPNMAEMAGIDKDTVVLEIGPGIGVLTKELALRAKKVLAIEIDERLREVLPETLSEFDNVEVIFGDCMKLNLAEILKDRFGDQKVRVCANLPYYITSPIIMMLLESHLPISSITAMVQKEAGERLCAEVGTRDAGAVTVAVDRYAKGEILFFVGRESFLPSPKVDSCVINLAIREKPEYDIEDEKLFFSLVKSGFSQRRKTVSNSMLSGSGVDKETLMRAFEKANISPTARIENLSMKNLSDLTNILSQEKNNG